MGDAVSWQREYSVVEGGEGREGREGREWLGDEDSRGGDSEMGFSEEEWEELGFRG